MYYPYEEHNEQENHQVHQGMERFVLAWISWRIDF